MKKKTICTILIFMMVFITPVRAYADAGTITVAGGTIATAGLTGTALVSAVAPYAVPIVLGVMVAGGMDVYLTEQSKNAGMTKTQYLKNKISEYCDEAGRPIDKFWEGFANNVSIAENGAIYLGAQARTNMKQFLNWLEQEGDIFDSSSGADETQFEQKWVFTNGMEIPISNTCTFVNRYGTTINAVANNVVGWVAIKNSWDNRYRIYPFRRGWFSITPNMDVGSWYGWYTNSNSDYELSLENATAAGIPCINNMGYSDFFRTLPANPTTEDTGASVPTVDTVIDTSGTGLQDTTGALSPSAGSTTVYTPDLTSGIDFTGIGNITTTINDYLDALTDILDGVQNPAIDGVDVNTGERIRVDVNPDILNPDVDTVPDQDVPVGDEEPEPVTDPDKPVDPEQNPEGATAPLKFNITNIFPFCIPFDIKDMLSLLNSDPVAPSYHVSWMVPIVNTPIEFTIDLSPWNSVALIARKMELLSFIVGLAVLTRNLIRG